MWSLSLSDILPPHQQNSILTVDYNWKNFKRDTDFSEEEAQGSPKPQEEIKWATQEESETSAPTVTRDIKYGPGPSQICIYHHTNDTYLPQSLLPDAVSHLQQKFKKHTKRKKKHTLKRWETCQNQIHISMLELSKKGSEKMLNLICHWGTAY